MSSLRISNSFSFKNHEKKSPRGSFLRARRVTVCCEVKWALLSAAQPQSVHRCHHTHRGRPPAPRSLLCHHPASFLWFRTPLRGFLALSPRRQPTSAKTRLTTPMSLSHTNPADITAKKDPLNSRARSVGWLAQFGVGLRKPARGDGKCHQAPIYYGALVTKVGSSWPPVCARPGGLSRRFIRNRRTTQPP